MIKIHYMKISKNYYIFFKSRDSILLQWTLNDGPLPPAILPFIIHWLAGLLGSAKPGLRNDLRTLLSRGWPIPCHLCDQPEKNSKN